MVLMPEWPEDAQKAVQRFVKRETLNVKGFGGRAFGKPTFHVLPLTFHGSWERCENADRGKARLGA